MLGQKIQENMIAALKEKNMQTLSVLRLLQSVIKNKQIEKRAELADDEVIAIIRKQIKELEEAKALFEKGGRTDLVDQNEAQIKILAEYIPPEMSDAELKKEVERIISENKELYDKNPKAIIGVCMKELKSKASSERIMAFLQ